MRHKSDKARIIYWSNGVLLESMAIDTGFIESVFTHVADVSPDALLGSFDLPDECHHSFQKEISVQVEAGAPGWKAPTIKGEGTEEKDRCHRQIIFLEPVSQKIFSTRNNKYSAN